MATVTYNQIERQVSNLLGNIAGGLIAATDTNYQAVASTTTRNQADFPPAAVQDAMLAAFSELIFAVAETPHHPERTAIQTDVSALSNGAAIPRTNSLGGLPVIGVPGRVWDTTNGKPLVAAPLDDVINYTQFSTSVYADQDLYLYAFYDQRIYHTRTTVRIDVCGFDRLTYDPTNTIPLHDGYEWAFVCGTVAHLAPREASFQPLLEYCSGIWRDQIQRIRSYVDPSLMTYTQGAPAMA